MIYILLYFAIVLAVFFGIAFLNYKQKNISDTTSAGSAWTIALFWPIILPLGLIVHIGSKFEKTFDNISEKGFKDDENK